MPTPAASAERRSPTRSRDGGGCSPTDRATDRTARPAIGPLGAHAHRGPIGAPGGEVRRSGTGGALAFALEVEGPERQIGVSRSGARGQPLWLTALALSPAAPAGSGADPLGSEPPKWPGALSADLTPHQSLRRQSASPPDCRFPRTLARGQRPLARVFRLVLPWWMGRSCDPRNCRSRPILQSPGLSPDFPQSSPGNGMLHTTSVTGPPQGVTADGRLGGPRHRPILAGHYL